MADEERTSTSPWLGDMPSGLHSGRILGGRYRLDGQLGRGGMGEVWRAWDLKLRTVVALKSILPARLDSERWRELLRDEVRAAHKVVSTNVCRVFDLFEADDREMISMEYVDGTTLHETVRERSPLDSREAREIASQLLVGLAEIHRAGLIHRDLKPSNVMITRSGRVVIMDFGLARPIEETSGSLLSGTPAYMSPEQAAGTPIDARADLYAVGMILAEMISPQGVRDDDSRSRLWKAIRHDPPRLPDTPWSPVLRKALESSAEARVSSASEMLRMLEDVTLRVQGAEHLNPYPGLASFTEEEAAFFFGREEEVERMWRKLDRPHLQALIGPSGAGKSSFLRAGLVPSAPAGWRIVVATPANRPFVSLARAFAPELAGDAAAVDDLLRFEEPDNAMQLVSRWRSRHEQALVIVDQFEELFTLNPAETQERFAKFLGRLPLEADVHVVLSMRDDFLFHCASHPALAPVFSEPEPLRPPIGPALRRALVHPALGCGYRFEDERLVSEIIAEVEGERGALPLMAFAVSQLWERRDRSEGVLTRKAYEEIGGVAGALAGHAEATLDRIGADRVPIVREIFRNLVTAQGTRAARDRQELLSVFPEAERGAVGTVLDALIDARLLTSYEVGDSA